MKGKGKRERVGCLPPDIKDHHMRSESRPERQGKQQNGFLQWTWMKHVKSAIVA